MRDARDEEEKKVKRVEEWIDWRRAVWRKMRKDLRKMGIRARCSNASLGEIDERGSDGLATPQQGLVLGRCFDAIDDHDFDRSLRADELEPELLLDRGIKAGRGIRIIAGARRITGAVALRFIGRPF